MEEKPFLALKSSDFITTGGTIGSLNFRMEGLGKEFLKQNIIA